MMPENKDKIEIIVNGREKVVSSSEVSFDEVVGLAFDPPPSGPDIVITVTYRNGAGRPPDGMLVKGRSAKVQNGTVFNVSYTDKS